MPGRRVDYEDKDDLMAGQDYDPWDNIVPREYRDTWNRYGPSVARAENPAKRKIDEIVGGLDPVNRRGPPNKDTVVTGQRDFSAAANAALSTVANIVTPRTDFQSSGGAGGTVLRTSSYRKRDKYKRAQQAKLRGTVRRILSTPPFRWNNAFTWFRSWGSGNDLQGVACIWIYSYRGTNTITASTGVPQSSFSAQTYQGPSNQFHRARDYIDGIYHPTGATSNAQNADWKVKVLDAQLDLTLTNQGGNPDDFIDTAASIGPSSMSTNRSIEYELYFSFPPSTITTDPSTQVRTIGDLWSKAASYEQAYGDNTSGTGDIPFTAVTNPSWEPQGPPFLKKFANVRPMGRGYLPTGGSVRILKDFKPSLEMTKQIFDADTANTGTATMAFKPGLTACVWVIWRGCPGNESRDFINTSTRLCFPSRLGFTVTNLTKYALDGNVQQGGRYTNWQY